MFSISVASVVRRSSFAYAATDRSYVYRNSRIATGITDGDTGEAVHQPGGFRFETETVLRYRIPFLCILSGLVAKGDSAE